MEMNRGIKAKLLAEILPAVERAKSNLVEGLEYETVMEFDFLQRCFYETLRIEPPVPLTAAQNMTRDVILNGIQFQSSSVLMINIQAMH
jgi:cytochrome P450